ncbi:hypothetical protein E1A91_D12G014800v1 [Gossypium mustelinum]|uniref:Uncharacterized protein n=1 Tax=Gossypium mustelinum TaxID=34275 RepID=A0A5D2S7R6_GOSMU|nr:hypothetical protein E1A91_D12G014800v1 [Gossypium mustelinum]
MTYKTHVVSKLTADWAISNNMDYSFLMLPTDKARAIIGHLSSLSLRVRKQAIMHQQPQELSYSLWQSELPNELPI